MAKNQNDKSLNIKYTENTLSIQSIDSEGLKIDFNFNFPPNSVVFSSWIWKHSMVGKIGNSLGIVCCSVFVGLDLFGAIYEKESRKYIF